MQTLSDTDPVCRLDKQCRGCHDSGCHCVFNCVKTSSSSRTGGLAIVDPAISITQYSDLVRFEADFVTPQRRGCLAL